MPFGVELPENLGSSTGTETAPEAPQPISTEGKGPEATDGAPKGATAVDLDKLESFRFEGRDWNRKDFKNAYLMREDYTRKTQELAEARKFSDNFVVDLERVVQDRSLLDKFRQIYPPEYVKYAEQILKAVPAARREGVPPQAETQANPLEEKLQTLEQKLAKWEQEKTQAEVKSAEAFLENQFNSLSKKYPFANAEACESRAHAAARQGKEITPELLERLFKQNDQEIKAKWEEHYKGKVTRQIDAGKSARDIGPGGGIPSGQPKTFRTIKEATQGFLADKGIE